MRSSRALMRTLEPSSRFSVSRTSYLRRKWRLRAASGGKRIVAFRFDKAVRLFFPLPLPLRLLGLLLK